tara:strand:- start:531 stop:731 length:201 start_codon:yes stop_codon:yes gene_type:complete
MSHYTIGYHDAEQHRHQICEYAKNSYDAIKNSKEDVPFLREHPSFIDYCTNETALEYLMGVTPMGR